MTRTLIFALLLFDIPAGARDLPLTDRLAQTRAEVLIAEIDMRIRTADSATLALEQWCADHRMAEPARIVVERDVGAQRPATGAERAQLGVSASEPVRYRRVRLVCGDHVLSEAENWYVPSRLEPAMNAMLDGSEEPFGKVIRALAPTRRTLTNRKQWVPSSSGNNCDRTAFSHEALVLDGKGRPLALVIENYKLELVCAVMRTEASRD